MPGFSLGESAGGCHNGLIEGKGTFGSFEAACRTCRLVRMIRLWETFLVVLG